MKDKERNLENISLGMILKWISEEKDPNKVRAFNIIKSIKLLQINPHMDEDIRVISSEKLNNNLIEGFNHNSQELIDWIENSAETINRSLAEYNSDYRQLVCNIILRSKLNGETHYGLLKRSDRVNESRLADSIGMIGGHANSADSCLFDALLREFEEEIKNISLDDSNIKDQIKLLGFIKDSNSQVSTQHLCVLYIIDLPDNMVNIKSRDSKETFIWISENHIRKYISEESNRLDSCVRIALSEIINSDK